MSNLRYYLESVGGDKFDEQLRVIARLMEKGYELRITRRPFGGEVQVTIWHPHKHKLPNDGYHAIALTISKALTELNEFLDSFPQEKIR